MQKLIYDSKSFTPFGFLRSAVFVTKEYFHRRPDRKYTPAFLQNGKVDEANQHLKTLERDGIVVIPGHFKGEQLATLQALFDKAVEGKPTEGVENSFSEANGCGAGMPILQAALDDMLLQIIGSYYKKEFGLGRGNAVRLLPTPPKRSESYQWHHDTRGRQIHGMILLNDVSPEGQRMSYLKGSHNVYYDRFRGESHGSRFENDVATQGAIRGDVVELAGPAGTVGLFDSNGLHSGNRNEKEKRDCLLFCYVSHPRHFKPVALKREELAQLPPHKRELVEMNPRLKVIG
jgi:hypothetical protein